MSDQKVRVGTDAPTRRVFTRFVPNPDKPTHPDDPILITAHPYSRQHFEVADQVLNLITAAGFHDDGNARAILKAALAAENTIHVFTDQKLAKELVERFINSLR